MDAERLVPRSSGNRHAVAFWARWRREADPLFPRFRRSARGRGRLLPRGEGSQERGWRDNFKPFEIQFEEILVTRDEVSSTRLHCRSDDVVIVRIATHTRNLAGLAITASSSSPATTSPITGRGRKRSRTSCNSARSSELVTSSKVCRRAVSKTSRALPEIKMADTMTLVSRTARNG